MTRVYSAGSKPEVRSVLRRLLIDLNVEVVGESADWYTTLAQVPIQAPEILLVDWDLLPGAAYAAVEELRKACPASLFIVLFSQLDIRQQAARSAGADAFISREETPERVVDQLRTLAASLPSK
jgi:DNA-binding NarL/FixJ family response regulator